MYVHAYFYCTWLPLAPLAKSHEAAAAFTYARRDSDTFHFARAIIIRYYSRYVCLVRQIQLPLLRDERFIIFPVLLAKDTRGFDDNDESRIQPDLHDVRPGR